MAPQSDRTDQQIAYVLAYVRNRPGNKAPAIPIRPLPYTNRSPHHPVPARSTHA